MPTVVLTDNEADAAAMALRDYEVIMGGLDADEESALDKIEQKLGTS